MPRPRDDPILRPVQTNRPTRIPAAALVVALLLIVAVLKPWGGSTDGHGTGGAGPGGSATRAGGSAGPGGHPGTSAAAPTPTAPPEDPNAIPCTAPDGWRLVTLQQSADRGSRTWLVVDGGAATGPANIGGPPARLAETDVVGLGFCADGGLAAPAADGTPASPTGGPTPAPTTARIAAAWKRDGAGRWIELAITLAAAGNDERGESGNALLYAPVARTRAGASPQPEGSAGEDWLPGSYAFRVEVAVGTATVVSWFRLDLVWPPVSETPSASSPSPVTPGAPD